MFAKLHSMGLMGIDGFLIDVEADLHRGCPALMWSGCREQRFVSRATVCALPSKTVAFLIR